MKKIVKLAWIAVLVIMLFTLSGCTDEVEQNNEPVQNEVVSNEEKVENEVVTTNTKESNLRDEFLKIFKNEEKFIGVDFEKDSKEGFLKDFEIGIQSEQIVNYAFVDMDGDGTEEAVAETSSDGGFYIVFHYEDGKMYGYLITARGMANLKADGSHYGTGGATSYGYSKMTFNKTEYTDDIVLASRNDNEYEVDGKPATKTEFEEFEKMQEAKPDAETHIFINDEIGTQILDFGDNGEVVYLQSTEGDPQSEYIYVLLTLKEDGTITEDNTFPEATGHGAMRVGTYVYKDGKIHASYKKASNPESPDDFYSYFSSEEYEIKDGKLYNQETPYYTAEYKRKD